MCPSLELLSSFLDGELVESQIIKVEKHLQRCVECTRNLSEFQKITQALLEAKEPDINAAQSLVERRLELFSRNRSQILSFWTDLFKKANSVRVVSFFLSVVFVFGLWFLMFDDSELKNLVQRLYHDYFFVTLTRCKKLINHQISCTIYRSFGYRKMFQL